LNHWIKEGGYSFPSGHTFNAFLLAMIFAFGIKYNSHSPKLQKLFFLPFLWAIGIGISRVALGAHSLVDVSVGALMGVLIGTLLLYIDFTRHLITHKKQF
jgi:phosphatidylglycerophosphatase B